LAMADLDNFKSVNDRFGHARGDGVLIWLARQLEQGLGTAAVVGRLGGEEFAALIVEPVATSAGALDRLRQHVRDGSAPATGLGVSISIGAGEIRTVSGDPAAALAQG